MEWYDTEYYRFSGKTPFRRRRQTFSSPSGVVHTRPQSTAGFCLASMPGSKKSSIVIFEDSEPYQRNPDSVYVWLMFLSEWHCYIDINEWMVRYMVTRPICLLSSIYLFTQMSIGPLCCFTCGELKTLTHTKTPSTRYTSAAMCSQNREKTRKTMKILIIASSLHMSRARNSVDALHDLDVWRRHTNKQTNERKNTLTHTSPCSNSLMFVKSWTKVKWVRHFAWHSRRYS